MPKSSSEAAKTEAVVGDGGMKKNLDDVDRGQRFNVEPFLPDTKGIRYVTVPPGKSETIVLVAVQPLGGVASDLVELHATGLLQATVVGLTAEETVIKSQPAAFGQSVGDDVRAKLESG